MPVGGATTQPASQTRRVRTITSLTEEQLSHKRHLDRKAQRALRQRTKSRIQDLEAELAEIRAQADGQGELLRQELANLRERNKWLEARLQQILKLATDTDCPDQHSSVLGSTQEPTPEISDCITGKSNREAAPLDPENADDSDGLQNDNEDNSPRNDNADHGLPMENSVADIPADTYMAVVAPSMRGVTDFRSPGHDHHSASTGVRDFYLDGSQVSVPSEGPSTHSPEGSTRRTRITQIQGANQKNTVSSVLCPHLPATCPLDRILLDFLTSRRALADSGTPTEVLVGPERPSMTAMLYPEMATREHPVSRVLVEVLHTFPHVKLPEKLAFMYLMHGTMRWQISPTKENYERLPHWLRPTAVQITTPHAAWIDNIPWPRVRDMLIEHPDDYPFEKFSEMYSHNVSVNWPYDEMDALLRWERDDGSDEMVLNNIFEKHILRLSNWTIAAKFEEVYPEMIQALR